VNLLQATSMINATPLSMAQVDYGGTLHTTTWDQEKIYGCVCDSSWTVGLLSGQTQETEYYGPDCSLRRCPTGDDPTTTENETDCNGLGGDYTQGVLLAGGTTTVTLHKAASSVTNFYNSMVIRFDAGTGANQLSIITAYNGSTRVATLSPAVTAPDATTSFTIFERGGIFAEGTATGGSSTYAVLANGSSTTNDYYNNMVLRITGGTGAGQAFSITDYTGSSKQAVLSKTPGTNTAADSTYTILGGQVGNLCHVDCSNRGACDASSGECQCYEGYYTVNCGQVNTSA
jgi:hypothetical protein